MIKYIVEKDGKFYLHKWCIFDVAVWDASFKGGTWWHIYKHHATPFNSKEELKQAYRNRKGKFGGFLWTR